jgi:hypothetical protein
MFGKTVVGQLRKKFFVFGELENKSSALFTTGHILSQLKKVNKAFA